MTLFKPFYGHQLLIGKAYCVTNRLKQTQRVIKALRKRKKSFVSVLMAKLSVCDLLKSMDRQGLNLDQITYPVQFNLRYHIKSCMVQSQAQQVQAANEVAMKIQTQRDFYDALHRNQFHLPHFKSRIVTTAFLQDVFYGKVWIPTIDQIKRHSCLYPPDRQQVQNELISFILNKAMKELNTEQRNPVLVLNAHLGKRAADREWLLDVLYLVSDNKHPFFAKDYAPFKRSLFGQRIADTRITDEFMQGIPASQNKGKRRQNFFQDKEKEMQLRHDHLMRQQQMVNVKLNQAEKKLQQMQQNQACVRGGIDYNAAYNQVQGAQMPGQGNQMVFDENSQQIVNGMGQMNVSQPSQRVTKSLQLPLRTQDTNMEEHQSFEPNIIGNGCDSD